MENEDKIRKETGDRGQFCHKYLFYASRPLLQAILLVTFLTYFGLPAITRYRAQRVVVVTSKKETGGIPAPTISIAAWNPRTKNGWKGNASMRYDLIGAYCKDEARPVVDCIEENTFRQSEIFKDVVLGFIVQKSLWNQENLIKEDFTTDWDGIFYVIDIKKRIGPNDSIDQLYVLLDTSLMYNIFLHDPTYFIVNENPAGVPNLMLKLNPNTSNNFYYRISLTEVCVKQSLSSQAGCRTKWDLWSPKETNICITSQQFRELAGLYRDMDNSELDEIIQLTGCPKPCFYKKYSFLGEKYISSFVTDHFLLSLWAVSNITRVETEQLIYPWTSLVAEFGGALGLFLGISFMSLWEGIYLLKPCFKY